MSQDHPSVIIPIKTDRASEVWSEERAAIQARIDEAIHLAMAIPRAA